MRGSGIISNAFGYCLYGFRKHQMGNRKSSCFRKSLTEHIKEKAADFFKKFLWQVAAAKTLLPERLKIEKGELAGMG